MSSIVFSAILSSMGRDKLKRNLQFKPLCKTFSTVECNNEDVINLLHEEMEALYLMDSKELYQADAAKEMGVSRPTFARIIKSARQKVTMMLITGSNLHIDDDKKDVMVMVPSNNKESIEQSTPEAKYLLIYHVENREILKRGVLANPVVRDNIRPGQVLPSLCAKHSINFFMAEAIGTGLKSALLSKGVQSFIEKDILEEKICALSN